MVKKAANSVELINGFSVIKEGDTHNYFHVKLIDSEGVIISTTDTEITWSMYNNKGVVIANKAATIGDPGTIYLYLDPEDVTGYGRMGIDITVTYLDGTVEKFPSDRALEVNITKSSDNLVETPVSFASLTYFDQKVTTAETAATNAQTAAVNASTTATDIQTEFGDAKTDADGTVYPTVKDRLDTEIGSMSGIDWLPSSLSRAISDLRDWQKQNAINVRTPPYNAKGDGVSDDSAAIQTAIDNCPENGIVYGSNKSYVVSKLILKSNMRMKGFNLLSKGTSEPVTESVINLGETTDNTTYENVYLKDISIDGRRHLHSNMPGIENGGRLGFRFIGHIENLTLENCSANYCASNGFNLHAGGSGTIHPDDGVSDPIKRNIKFINCSFEWNRHHGGAGDSVERIDFINCKFNNNGLTTGASEGEQGGTLGGNLYANGVDFEGYTNRSMVRKVKFTDCEFLQNAKHGVLFLEQAPADDVDFAPRNDITFRGCKIDKGQFGNGRSISFAPIAANFGIGVVYENLNFYDCSFDGHIYQKDNNDIFIDGGEIITDSSVLGTLDNTTNTKIGMVKTHGKKFDGNEAVYGVSLNADGTLSLGSQSYVRANPSASQTFSSAATKVEFGNVQTDRQGEFSNSRFTSQNKGVYAVNLGIRFNVVTSANVLVYIYKNGVQAGLVAKVNGLSGDSQLGGNYFIDLNVGDYVEVFLISNASDLTTISSSSNTYINLLKMA